MRSSAYDRLSAVREPMRPLQVLGLASVIGRLAWRANRKMSLGLLVATLVTSVGVAAQLLVARSLLQDLLATGDDGFRSALSAALLPLVAFVVATLALAVALSAQTELGTLLGEQVSGTVLEELLSAAGSVPLELFRRPEFHDELTRSTVAAEHRAVSAVRGLAALATAAGTCLAVALALALIAPLLVVLGLIATLPEWRRLSANAASARRLRAELTSNDRDRNCLTRALTGTEEADEVRAFALSDLLRARFRGLHQDRLRLMSAVAWERLRRTWIAESVGALTIAAVLVTLLWAINHGHLELADAGTGVLGLLVLRMLLRGVVSQLGGFWDASLFAEDLERFRRVEWDHGMTRGQINEPTTSRPEPRTITVEDVVYTYPGRSTPAVAGVSFELRPGQLVALVGPNGSGKTTITKLLSGLLEPIFGRVLLDGHQASASALRACSATLFQDFVRWHISAGENVGVGDVAHIDDLPAIRDAARRSRADVVIERLPEGYDTLLSAIHPGAVNLSPGQWQLIAYARALVRRTALLVLDEPTAALDPLSEAYLLQELRENCGDGACLLISHRLSTVRFADVIHVLDEGRIVESGDHAELMHRGGLYTRMFALQASGEPLYRLP